ncbi:histidine--tRNA ligase [Wolbachia pipientis]|uniref:Histidine--tRNA ligase n=1 Tax=Wolbachia pipientis TaxID=955 RepID=A0A1E7QJF3_WOLPI|nr:histidine--tRNA ligase [Wolbachia pipientis]OEY86611.1 histidine--tRNA ligase [Wolbachia pipientis]
MTIQTVRGTKDLLSDDWYKFKYIQDTAHNVSRLYGFIPVETPILEYTEVFMKTLGESSDIITKEMYTFEDKSGKSITLRPEFTAAIMRLLKHKKLQIPVRLFSSGPLFRYERPQKGRQRQFNQINFEVFGLADPRSDIELISLSQHLLIKFGINDNAKLEINSLGDNETIIRYRKALVSYFEKYTDDLSEDSKNRLTKNPIRILDSKDKKDQLIIHDAPKIDNYYTKESLSFFDKILNGLQCLGISYTINSKLVRGLDYYCHTVFEFVTQDLGSQGAVFAGGRYDTIIAGKYTPAVGFAGGIERIMELINFSSKEPRPIYLIPIGAQAEVYSLVLTDKLRKSRLYSRYDYDSTLKSKMKKAHQVNAKVALIFGDEELGNKTFKIKDMDTGTEEIIMRDNIIEKLELLTQDSRITHSR